MRVSKNWVKFNKMFTLSPWDDSLPHLTQAKKLQSLHDKASVDEEVVPQPQLLMA